MNVFQEEVLPEPATPAGWRILTPRHAPKPTLQRIVLADDRFVPLGLRTEGGFIGGHDRIGRRSLPQHISARHDDLEELMAGVIDFDREVAPHLDARVRIRLHPPVRGWKRSRPSAPGPPHPDAS